MSMTDAQENSISQAYDVIAAIWAKQDRVIPFDLCYGDGTRFPGITEAGARIVWEEMHGLFTQAHMLGFQTGQDFVKGE